MTGGPGWLILKFVNRAIVVKSCLASSSRNEGKTDSERGNARTLSQSPRLFFLLADLGAVPCSARISLLSVRPEQARRRSISYTLHNCQLRLTWIDIPRSSR